MQISFLIWCLYSFNLWKFFYEFLPVIWICLFQKKKRNFSRKLLLNYKKWMNKKFGNFIFSLSNWKLIIKIQFSDEFLSLALNWIEKNGNFKIFIVFLCFEFHFKDCPLMILKMIGEKESFIIIVIID